MAIDIRKVTLYPPEVFMEATPIDLVAGENTLFEYTIRDFILAFTGFSFNPLDGAKLKFEVDNAYSFTMSDLGAVKGLDYEEDMKFYAKEVARAKLNAPSATSAYQYRYKVMVTKPTVAMKLMMGMTLTKEEESLRAKYDLDNLIKQGVITKFDIMSGIEEVRTQTVRLTNSGSIVRVFAPKGKKVVLLNVSATRPTSSASGYVNVTRDDVDTMTLDLYCLPSLPYNALMRVVATDKLEVEFDMKVSGTYPIRVVYGIGRISLVEKVMWDLELTPQERALAESLDLYDKVRAGVV